MLIGLCGKPKSGKSEVRRILEEQHGFITVNAKIPIIHACARLTGLQPIEFTTQEGKEKEYKGVPLRVIMGKVGAVMEELFGDYHTIERALAGYHLETNQNFVVDSLRMSQPVHFTGTVIEVVSDRSIDTGHHFDTYLIDNSKPHFIINNNGDFENLENQISRILDELHV